MNHDTIALSAQADLLLLLCEFLQPPQEHDFVPRPLSECEVGALVKASKLENASQLNQLLSTVLANQAQLPRSDWQLEYRRLFDGSIACPLNEAAYIRRDKGAILGDLCGFYNAFGWRPSPASGERPDHLVCQLQYLAVLLVMLARAKDLEPAEVTAAALGQFWRQHLSEWLPLAAEQLQQTSRLAYFQAVGRLAEMLGRLLQEYHQWPVDQRPVNHLASEDEPDEVFQCGAPDLVSISLGDDRPSGP